DGEAAAVDRDRVADLAVLDDDARAEREPVAVAADDLAELLDDPGEHCLFPGRGPNPALLPEMGPLPHPVPYVEPQVVSQLRHRRDASAPRVGDGGRAGSCEQRAAVVATQERWCEIDDVAVDEAGTVER